MSVDVHAGVSARPENAVFPSLLADRTSSPVEPVPVQYATVSATAKTSQVSSMVE